MNKKNILEQYILEKIKSGSWKEGHKLPSEFEIIKKFNLSKSTVRKTIQKLNNQEILYSIQGSGVWVSRFFSLNQSFYFDDNLLFDKSIDLSTNYKIPEDVYQNSPFLLDDDAKTNLFRFIKIYFLNDEIQGYSVNWVFLNNLNIDKEKIIDEELIDYKNFFHQHKIIKRFYFVHLFNKPIRFDLKLFRMNFKYIPATYTYFLDKNNNIVMIELFKIHPEKFKKCYIKSID